MVMLAKATKENKEEEEGCGLTVCEATEPGRGGGVLSWSSKKKQSPSWGLLWVEEQGCWWNNLAQISPKGQGEHAEDSPDKTLKNSL